MRYFVLSCFAFFAASVSAQITIDGGNVSTGSQYGNVLVQNGAVRMNGLTVTPSGGIQVQNGTGYQRQGDVVINDTQNGQAAVAIGSNQRATNRSGNVAENRAGGQRSQDSSPDKNDENFWGRGGFWGGSKQ
jgi:hypothetical protein